MQKFDPLKIENQRCESTADEVSFICEFHSGRIRCTNIKHGNFGYKNIVSSKKPQNRLRWVWDKFYFNMCDSYHCEYVCMWMYVLFSLSPSCAVNSLALAPAIWLWLVGLFILCFWINWMHTSHGMLNSQCLIFTYTYAGCWLHAIRITYARISTHSHTHTQRCLLIFRQWPLCIFKLVISYRGHINPYIQRYELNRTANINNEKKYKFPFEQSEFIIHLSILKGG